MSTVPDEAPAAVETHRKPPFLRRVRIRNFKSIKFCDVTLEPLTVLVGRNGSGKSNFVEALAFLRDLVTLGVVEAITRHGGPTVKYRKEHEPVSIVVDYVASRTRKTSQPTTLRYGVKLVGLHDRPRIVSETLMSLDTSHQFLDEPEAVSDVPQQFSRLNGFDVESRPLRSMYDYNFIPRDIRLPQPFEASFVLAKQGHNVGRILDRIRTLKDDGWAYQRIQQYLNRVVSEVLSVIPRRIADHDTVSFNFVGGAESLDLFAANVSDGTLRALTTLVAAYQSDPYNGPPSLVAIEEPETALHPAAMHALVDALDEATGRTQILLTTHSTELLDNPTIRPENVRVVEMVNGETVITPVDDASVQIVKEGLNTLGRLEREDRLQLNRKALREREEAAEKLQ